MTALAFNVVDAAVERYSASPAIRLRLRVGAQDGDRIDAIALRARVQIEPAGRTYTAGEEARLREIFGERERWVHSVRPLQWTETSIMVGSFSRETTFEISLACTYDLNVAGGKFISALDAGDIPLRLFFTGTLFRGSASGFNVEMLPWNLECTTRLSMQLWYDAMNSAFPDQAWIRVDRSTFEALRSYRADHSFSNWEEAFSVLLAGEMRQVK